MNREMINSGVEWIGTIPKKWKLERIQWHLEEIKESNNPIKTTQVLSLTNKLGVIPYEEKGEQGNKSKENLNEYKLAYPNTIVANSMNILIGSVGLSKYYGCVSPVYYVYKSKQNANIEFFNYLFQTSEFQKELRKYANGILEIRLRVSSNNILKRCVPIPTIDTQNKIVEIIKTKVNKIDELIKNQEIQIENIEFYKQQLITEIVTKGLSKYSKLKNSGVDWIGDIPENWKIYRVKNIGNTQNGISKSSEYFGTGFPFVSYGDVYKNWSLVSNSYSGLIQSNDKERENYSIKYGDILFTRTSETIEEVGFSSVCLENIDYAVYAGFLIRFRPNVADDIIETRYAKYYFRANLLRKYLVKEMNLVTRASLSQELLGAMSVIVPPKNEQLIIADYLDEKITLIDELVSIKKEKIEKLQEYKKSIIYEYVTGKKEVFV